MGCVCASAITAEMKDWVALGGGNSGCCGNSAHTYGFHREAASVPTSDYSRRHEAAKPYNMSWGCAGDFYHGQKATLMARHVTVLQRLMRGELPMICEFIGKPWKDKPVYYWARWNGNNTLQRYTGKGHDTWSHISWWRSKANQRAHLWKPTGSSSVVPAAGTVAPKYPGYTLVQKTTFDANVRTWQAQAKARGAGLAADGYMGAKTVEFVKRFQTVNKIGTTGTIGPVTWAEMWDKSTTI